MSDKVLLGADWDSLVKDFADVQSKFGSVFQERYERLVDQLEKELGQTPVLSARAAPT